jgi:hypothetical protein
MFKKMHTIPISITVSIPNNMNRFQLIAFCLFEFPGIRICCFSTGKRQTEQTMQLLKVFIAAEEKRRREQPIHIIRVAAAA